MASPKEKMLNYFKKNLKKGYNTDALKWALIGQGYSRPTVEEALIKAIQDLAEEAPILKTKPEIKHEIIDEYNKPITIKKSWWSRLFG